MTLESIKQDISKGMVPLLIAIALAMGAAAAAFTVGTVWAGVRRDSDDFRAEIASIKVQLTELKLQGFELAASVQRFAAQGERFSLYDHMHFCWQAERLNNGWKCPPVPGTAAEQAGDERPGGTSARP